MVTLCIAEVGALLHSWRQRTVFVSDTLKKPAQSKHTRNQQEPAYHNKITSASTEEKVHRECEIAKSISMSSTNVL